MKAFLLAAGLGTRLQPITLNTPKCLVPIGEEILIDIWYSKLEILNVTEVLVNTYHLSKKVEKHITELDTNIKTIIINEKELLGSAGTILANKDFIDDDPFWIIYSDNLTTANLESLLTLHHLQNPLLTMGLFRSKTPELCGVVDIDKNGLIIDFEEKPKIPKNDLVNAGIMVASPQLLNHIPSTYPCDLSFHVIPKIMGKMYGKIFDGYFIDIGTLENYKKAQKEWPIFQK